MSCILFQSFGALAHVDHNFKLNTTLWMRERGGMAITAQGIKYTHQCDANAS